MEHEIVCENGTFKINGENVPEGIKNYELGLKNETPYQRISFDLKAGDKLTFSSYKLTRVTLEI